MMRVRMGIRIARVARITWVTLVARIARVARIAWIVVWIVGIRTIFLVLVFVLFIHIFVYLHLLDEACIVEEIMTMSNASGLHLVDCNILRPCRGQTAPQCQHQAQN